MNARALHYVFKIGDRQKSIEFFKNVLGMKVSQIHTALNMKYFLAHVTVRTHPQAHDVLCFDSAQFSYLLSAFAIIDVRLI
ncbi:unnamed protein product [Echinostoma caproni]|uniref:Glyoxalase domain-containing protein n=1 Tax=Echinostoma caproni TaxID=27848 RepID=A0A183A4N4_9TREM|nr:unnamed protein product [Echinostoma caproni]